MSIAEYVSQADRLETRHCSEHKEQPYSLGCGACLTVFCASCISPLNICTNGKDHKLVNRGDLVTRVTSDINKLREAMIYKEEKLSTLFKKASKDISEYEQETKEMIEKLHETRDKQIDVIQTKYKKLEEELKKTRRETRAEILLFMEDKVCSNLTSLSNHRMRIDARVRNNHQVDIVNTYRDTQTEIVGLTDVQLPVLTLDNVKVLSVTGQIIKHFRCPMLKDGCSAACAIDESSVIVTSYYSSQVFRVDINSKQTLWKCASIVCPQAAAMYGKNLVCIASESCLSFLDVNTGQLMSEIEVSNIQGISKVDIDIHDTTLIVSTCEDGTYKVLFFKVN